MPKELDLEVFEQELEQIFTPDQRMYIARLLHDHVSGLVTNLATQIEIVRKMVDRDMDYKTELASLKENVSAASKHIVGIEKAVRPKTPED